MFGDETTVARGAASLYASSVVILLLNTGYFIVITNILTPSEIGVIAALNIIILFFGVVSTVSLPQALVKFIPEFLGKGEPNKAKGSFKASLVLVVGLSSAVAASLALTSGAAALALFKGEALPIWITLAALDLWLFSLSQFFLATLIGLNQIPRASFFQTIGFALRSISGGSFVIFGQGISGVLVGFIIGDALTLILSASRSFRSLRGDANEVPIKMLLGYSAPLLVAGLISFGISQIDKVFTWLTRVAISELGIYNIAVGASTIAASAPIAVTTALVPTLSSLDARQESLNFRNLSRVYTRYVSLIAMPVAFMIASLSTSLIQIFGTAYYVGAFPLSIVSISVGITSVVAVYSGGLLATKRTKPIMLANIIGLVAFTALLAVLVPAQGFLGAAWSRMAMNIVVAVVIIYFVRRSGLLVLDRKAFVGAMVASVLAASLLYFSTNAIGGYRRQIAALPILIPSGVVVYLTVLRVLKIFNQDDVNFLKRLLPRRLEKLAIIAAKLAGVS